MFNVYCPRHGHEVLLGFRRLRRVVNIKPGVIVVELLCHDGEVLRLVTGSATRVPDSGARVPDSGARVPDSTARVPASAARVPASARSTTGSSTEV